MRISQILYLPLCILFLSFTPCGDHIIEFTAYLAEGKVNIQWVANKRSKIKSFTLERSRDNIVFEPFKTIMDDGKKPESAEFLESDFKPMLGWSYYRIICENSNGEIFVTPSAPIFFKANRMKKGELIVPQSLIVEEGEMPSENISTSIEGFNNLVLVFILRNKVGEEFYIEDSITVVGDSLRLSASDKLPAGEYMITACTRTELLGLSVRAQ